VAHQRRGDTNAVAHCFHQLLALDLTDPGWNIVLGSTAAAEARQWIISSELRWLKLVWVLRQALNMSTRSGIMNEHTHWQLQHHDKFPFVPWPKPVQTCKHGMRIECIVSQAFVCHGSSCKDGIELQRDFQCSVDRDLACALVRM